MEALAYVDPARVSSQKAPTAKQVYVIAHLALEVLGRSWPDSRRDASDLIRELEFEPVVRALANTPSAWLETN
jgi:hypothetical protein